VSERLPHEIVNDRFATEFQESGIASTAMMRLAEIVATVDALGIDPREVVVLGTAFTTEEGEKVIADAAKLADPDSCEP
jgi:hypothetical protein